MLPKIDTERDDKETMIAKCQKGIRMINETLKKMNERYEPKSLIQATRNWRLKYEETLQILREENLDQPLYHIREIFEGHTAEHQPDLIWIDGKYEDSPLRDIPLAKEIEIFRIPQPIPEFMNRNLIRLPYDHSIVLAYKEKFPRGNCTSSEYYTDDDYIYVLEKTNRKVEYFKIFEYPKIDIRDDARTQLYYAREALVRVQGFSQHCRCHKGYDEARWLHRLNQWQRIIDMLTMYSKDWRFTNIHEVPDDLRDRFYDPFGHNPKLSLLEEWDKTYEILRDDKEKIWYKLHLIDFGRRYEFKNTSEREKDEWLFSDQTTWNVEVNVEYLEYTMKEASDYGREDIVNILKEKWTIWKQLGEMLDTSGKPFRQPLPPPFDICFEPPVIDFPRELEKLKTSDEMSTQFKKCRENISKLYPDLFSSKIDERRREVSRKLIIQFEQAINLIDERSSRIFWVPFELKEIFYISNEVQYLLPL